jgi:hypothetical protein
LGERCRKAFAIEARYPGQPHAQKKSASALLHPDAGTAAILRDELDAGLLNGFLNGFPNVVGHCRAFSMLAL